MEQRLRILRALVALHPNAAISYAKVRALTRVATPDNEVSLLDFAQAGTAAQVERFVGAWRRVDRVAAAEAEAAVDRLFREAQGEPKAERVANEVTPAQRRADALGLLAEVALASDLDRGCAGDRYQVVLHMEAHKGVAAGDGLAGTMELDHGALHVSAETSRRLSCDAAVVRMQHDADGAILDVGRKTRSVPPSIRRALQARDRSCRFPGCTARRCDAHHVEHWVDGGATSLENLVLLCRRHHRAAHEGGCEMWQNGNGTITFLRPNGAVLEVAPALPTAVARLDEPSWEPDDIPVWDGTPLHLAYAIDVLYKRPDAKGAAPRLWPTPRLRRSQDMDTPSQSHAFLRGSTRG